MKNSLKKMTVSGWFMALIPLYVLLPDFIPLLGEIDDAALVAWAMNHLKAQADEKLAKVHRLRKKKDGPSNVIDVECRRVG